MGSKSLSVGSEYTGGITGGCFFSDPRDERKAVGLSKYNGP
jgi:hypothetical protein